MEASGTRTTTSSTRNQTGRRDATLLGLATALAATDSVEDVALAVRDLMRQDLDASCTTVSMIEGPFLTTPALGQLDDDTEQRWLRLPLDVDSPAHRVARTGKPLVFHRLDQLLEAFPDAADTYRRTGLRSGVVLPLLISGASGSVPSPSPGTSSGACARTRPSW